LIPAGSGNDLIVVAFNFDWYNSNVNNASGWTNFGGTSAAGTYIAVSNDWCNAAQTSTNPAITVDLSSIAGLNSDANVGIRLVSAYDSTGNVSGYTAAALTSGHTVAYNNSSGNWRFDKLTVSGVTVPESYALALVALGFIGSVARCRNQA